MIKVDGHNGMKSAELKADPMALRKTIQDGFDCNKSLGSPTVLPLSCATVGTVATILRANGTSLLTANGKIGVWSIAAQCTGDEIIFTATKPGNDPLTNKSWATSPSLTDPATGLPDLFKGTSDFCASYFGGADVVCAKK